MTGFAILCDPESRIAIVAGATGLTILHLCHGCLVGTSFCQEKVRMTFVAAKHAGMHRVAESDRSDVLGPDFQVNCSGVTCRAISRDGKRGVTIVTGAARLPRLHFLHTNLVTVGFRPEGLGMALVAAEHAGVDCVAEDNLPHHTLNGNILCSLMTAAAIALDSEGGITVMARAAGLSGFHFLHAHLIAVALRDENIWVTFVTTEHTGVHFMTENNFFRGTIVNFNITGMTCDTITGDTESFPAIVTKAAGLTVGHLGHGE